MDSNHSSVTADRIDSTTPLAKPFPAIESGLLMRALPSVPLSKTRAVLLISSMNATVLVAAMNTGMLTVNLPHIGADLHISRGLLLWPALVYSLAQGVAMLPAGAVADVVGNRAINLIGTFILSLFVLGLGLATSGFQIIVFRIFQGVGVAMCFPTAVSILSEAFPRGKIRNIAFGCLGLGTPLGFAAGIVIGGWFESTSISWRPGFYLVASITMLLCFANCFVLPKEHRQEGVVWTRLQTDIDWMGVFLSSFSMGLLSYSLASISGSLSSFRDPAKVLLLVIALATIPLFIFWMDLQEKRKKPALIPNSLWKNSTFSAICIMVLLSWATLQSLEWFISLFYQQVQHISPIETAVRYLPNITAGSILNILTGLIVHRVWVNYYVVFFSALCSCAPLLMAITDPSWSWWWTGFWVMLLLPVSVDVNFTVANLIITDIFPKETQALAGAVYQSVAQLGISIGIGILAVISNSITDESRYELKDSPEALLKGFRAVFWTCFVMMVVSTLAGTWGLWGRRKIKADDDHKRRCSGPNDRNLRSSSSGLAA